MCYYKTMNIKKCIKENIDFDFSEFNVNVEDLIIESVSSDKGD